MQEHIRRAHPEHYIQKLPATEESFLLMISTDPSTRAPVPQPPSSATSAPAGAFPSFAGLPPLIDRFQGYQYDRLAYETSNPGTPRMMLDDYGTGSSVLPPTASAAAALAQLHGHKIESEWETDLVSYLPPFFCLPRISKADSYARTGSLIPRAAAGPAHRLSFPRYICPTTSRASPFPL